MRRSAAIILFATAGTFAALSTGYAQQVRFSEGVQKYRAGVGRPILAADGNSFYVGTRAYDPDGDSMVSRVLHLGFEGEEREPDITRPAPYFSPDGKYDAFKSSGADGTYGVNVYDVAAGEYRFLAPVYESNAFLGHRASKNIVWSPDGSQIAYVSAEGEQEIDETAPRVIDRLLFKSRTYLSDNRRTHVFVVSVNGGEPRQLTFGTYDEHSIDWSPDGREIVFISNRAADPDDVHRNDVWAVDVASGAVRQITDTPAPEFAPRYSPDGQRIAYLGGIRPMNTRDSPMEDDQLWVVAAEGGMPSNLSGALDRRVRSFEWSPDGRHLYFRANDRGATHLFRVPATGGEIEPIVTGEVELTAFVVSPTQDRIVYGMVSHEQPAELYVTTLDGAWHRQITHLQRPFTEYVSLAVPEEFWFESFDGTRVQGWLTKPNPFEGGRKYPLILTVHGGPHNAYTYSISWTAQYMAEAGYGVLEINPRGSIGYGQEFADGTLNDWGGADYRDLMAGVDYIVEHYNWVDGERLAVTGYSYGGYMTNWIITQTDRFRAAAAGGSISNLISFYGTSLYHLLIETEFPGELWENYDLLWDRSPLKHVANVSTPTLLFHGEDDYDVPVSQAEEFFVALRKLGVETELVRYPGMGHEFNSFRNVQDAFGRLVAWFDKYVKDSAR